MVHRPPLLAKKCLILAFMMFLRSSQVCLSAQPPVDPAVRFQYLHRLGEASADHLFGDGEAFSLGVPAQHRGLETSRRVLPESYLHRTLRPTVNSKNLRSDVERTVLVTYRYPSLPSFSAPLMTEPKHNVYEKIFTSDLRVPYRLLAEVKSRYNVSMQGAARSDATTAEADAEAEKMAANLMTRNMVLSRLYLSFMGKPQLGQLGGLQTPVLPFVCSYLTGLHMEVLYIAANVDVEALRMMLGSDPYVEEVSFDEIMEGSDPPSVKETFAPNRAVQQANNSLRGYGVELTDVLTGLPNLQNLTVPESSGDEQFFEPVLSGVAASGLVQPDDHHFNQQWPHYDREVGLQTLQAWQQWTGEDSDFVVALVDSGVDLDHPDLRNQYWRNRGEKNCFDGKDDDGNGYIDDCIGYDWIGNDNVPQDENGHGTVSAGIIAASTNNGIGIAGVCWGCRLMILRTLDKDIRGTISGFIKAIDYAVVQNVKVSNNSYGGRGSQFSSLKTAVERAENRGMLFVAAAGNYGNNNDLTRMQPTYPASYNATNVISVAAIDQKGRLASFSSYGKKTVSIAAPGVDILSTGLNKKYVRMDGTSFSTPFVTATAALLLSREPYLTVSQIKSRILRTAKKLPALRDKIQSEGTLNIAAALAGTSEQQRSPEMGCARKKWCPDNADCVDTKLGPRCQCHRNYRQLNKRCVPKTCESSSDCLVSEVCEARSGAAGGGGENVCTCRPGFHRANATSPCSDIDECKLDIYICPYGSACANTEGAFDCICEPGYKWNGIAWIQKGAKCEPLSSEDRKLRTEQAPD